MTIAASYLVSDGVVFGADSSTTVEVNTPHGTGVVQLLTHSQKVFEVGTASRIGVCTWGAGSIGHLSHRTIIARLADQINKDSSVQEAAEKLIGLVEPVIKSTGIPFVGYYLGGWNPGSHEPACFLIEVRPTGHVIQLLSLGVCTFSGNPKFFARVFRGFDPQIVDALKSELKSSFPKESLTNFDSIFDKVFKKVSEPLVAAGFQDLPIREAIDFVYSYLHVTLKAEKFKFGPPSCGGPIEVGFITTDRFFRWVRHKPFHSAITEQDGDYDV